MSQQYAQTFYASEAVAAGLVVKRAANTSGGDAQVAVAADGDIGVEPIIGIAEAAIASGATGSVVTKGMCWATAGDDIAVTVTDLTTDANGKLVPATSAKTRVATNHHRVAAVANAKILVCVDIVNANVTAA